MHVHARRRVRRHVPAACYYSYYYSYYSYYSYYNNNILVMTPVDVCADMRLQHEEHEHRSVRLDPVMHAIRSPILFIVIIYGL